MENLARAVIKVMQQVRGMEKNSKVGSGRSAYSGVKDQDVKEVFNKALAEHGLAVLPIGIDEETELSSWMVDGQYGTQRKQSVFTKVKTKYLLLHESGESVEISGYGHGVDPQDKGAGKATTYALKNALLYTFLTPVGKIDDTDTTHSDEHETPQLKPAQKPKTTNAQKPAMSADEMVERLGKCLNQEGLDKCKKIIGPHYTQLSAADKERVREAGENTLASFAQVML